MEDVVTTSLPPSNADKYSALCEAIHETAKAVLSGRKPRAMTKRCVSDKTAKLLK